MTIQALIIELKERAQKAKFDAKNPYVPQTETMQAWYEGKANGFELAALWLERDVAPRYPKKRN